MSTYQFQMMRGTDYVRHTVGDFLEAHLPTYIQVLREQNPDINPKLLVNPAQYDSEDPFDTNPHKFPVVGTFFTATEKFENVLLRSDGSSDYTIRYSSILFVTVKTPLLGLQNGVKKWASRADTIRMRDYLLAAMRDCVLGTPSFGTALNENRIGAVYDSIREQYPQPMKLNDQSPQWICSGLMNIDIDVIETVSNPIIGTVSEINVDVDELPFE